MIFFAALLPLLAVATPTILPLEPIPSELAGIPVEVTGRYTDDAKYPFSQYKFVGFKTGFTLPLNLVDEPYPHLLVSPVGFSLDLPFNKVVQLCADYSVTLYGSTSRTFQVIETPQKYLCGTYHLNVQNTSALSLADANATKTHLYTFQKDVREARRLMNF